MLDLKDPSQVKLRSPHPILEPEREYERIGDVPDVVFPTSATVVDGTLFSTTVEPTRSVVPLLHLWKSSWAVCRPLRTEHTVWRAVSMDVPQKGVNCLVS